MSFTRLWIWSSRRKALGRRRPDHVVGETIFLGGVLKRELRDKTLSMYVWIMFATLLSKFHWPC